MDDDYLKGLRGQATHDSLPNTMGILQREQEMRHKKQNEEFERKQREGFAKNIPPRVSSSHCQVSSSSSESKSSVNQSEENTEITEKEKTELTPEQHVGAGLIFLGFLLWYFVSEFWPWILTGIGVIIVVLIAMTILEDDET